MSRSSIALRAYSYHGLYLVTYDSIYITLLPLFTGYHTVT